MSYDIKETTQHDLLISLTPAYTSKTILNKQFDSLKQSKYRFNNFDLFNTDSKRQEILNNIDTILATYDGDLIDSKRYESGKITKELYWAALQLFARLQAIETEAGTIINPHTEYAKCLKQLRQCHTLLLKNGARGTAKKISALLQGNHLPKLSENPNLYKSILNYFGISNSDAEQIFKAIINKTDEKNDIRLYWVWTRPNMELGLDYLHEYAAKDLLSETAVITSAISWQLYLFRGSFFGFSLLEKLANDPWFLTENKDSLSPEELALYRGQHRKAFWDIYKYRVLNDWIFWGPTNFLCAKYWFGTGLLGWLGDFATCILLCADINAADSIYADEKLKYQEALQDYTKQLAILTQEIKSKLVEEGISGEDEANLFLEIQDRHRVMSENMILGQPITNKKLFKQLNNWVDLQKKIKDHQMAWTQKEASMNVDCYYAYALLAAFFVCTCLLIREHLDDFWIASLSSSGTMLCLALTIVYRTVKTLLEIQALQENKKIFEEEEQKSLEMFLQFAKEENHTANLEQKMQELYMVIIKSGVQANLQTLKMQYKWLELFRTSLLRLLVPALLALSLIYLPTTFLFLPIYVYTIAFSAVLSYGLEKINKMFDAPDSEKISTAAKFDAEEYKDFCKNPHKFSKETQQFKFFLPSDLRVSTEPVSASPVLA